jgi:hypothetical protein
MSDNSSKDLFSQVREAHRLLAAYYERINHLIEDITIYGLGLEFYFWEPSRFSRPLKRKKNQLKKWSWDLLPGVLTKYVFVYGELGNKQLGDWILRINVVSDTVVEQSESVQNPLEIKVAPKDGRSVLRFYIIGPRKHVDGNWFGRAQEALGKLECDSKVRCIDNEEDNIYACAFEVPMEQLTTEEGSADKLAAKIMAASEALKLPKHQKDSPIEAPALQSP